MPKNSLDTQFVYTLTSLLVQEIHLNQEHIENLKAQLKASRDLVEKLSAEKYELTDKFQKGAIENQQLFEEVERRGQQLAELKSKQGA